MFNGYLKEFPRLLQGILKHFSKFPQGNFEAVSSVCPGCLKNISLVFHGCFKNVSRTSNEVAVVFEEYFKCVKKEVLKEFHFVGAITVLKFISYIRFSYIIFSRRQHKSCP